MKIPPLPQKKSAFQENAPVMDAMKEKSKYAQFPEVVKAKQQLAQYLQQKNINPDVLIQIGNMAQQAIKDKNIYPMLKDYIIKNKVLEPNEFKEGIDYKLLAKFVAMGALAQEIKGGV